MLYFISALFVASWVWTFTAILIWRQEMRDEQAHPGLRQRLSLYTLR